MTKITIEKTSLGRTIKVRGHAGDGKSAEGSIICAAVSMLVQTLAQNIYDAEDEGIADIIDITLKSGEADISYITDSDSVNIAADGICKGFELLADSYPDTVALCMKNKARV